MVLRTTLKLKPISEAHATGERQMTSNDQGASAIADPAEAMLAIVAAVVRELKPGRAAPITLDASLDRDLGLDSFARVELASRIEAAFGVGLGEDAPAAAEHVRDLLEAVLVARGTSARPVVAPGEVAKAGTGKMVAGAMVGAVPPIEMSTLVEVLSWHATQHPDRPHLQLYADDGEGEVLTYGALFAEAQAVACGLQAAEVVAGDSVGLMLPTGRSYFAAFCGALLAGAVCVPVYPPTRAQRIEEHVRRLTGILANAGARVLIVPEDAKPLAASLQAQIATLRYVSTVESLSQKGARPQAVATAGQEPALLQYTSGSTGAPKGVTLSHANLLANIRAMAEALEVGGDDVFVSWLPLYHDMGLIGAWLGSLYQATPLVLMSPLAFLARPARWLRAIHQYRGTISGGPNFAYELLLRHIRDEQLKTLDLSSWRVAFNGAEPVSAATIERFSERFGAAGFRRDAMMPVYGLAENSVGLTFPPLGREPVIDRIEREALARSGRAVRTDREDATALRLVACGQPLPNHDIRIIDAAGFELPERQEGRLQFRGPSASPGYWRNEEATRQLLAGDWRETGDLGYVAEGDLYITARVKDLIIRGGRNIHPADIEDSVGALDGVLPGRVAAFGDTNGATGSERLIVLAETRKREPQVLEALRAEINGLVADLAGAPPDEVVLAPPNAIPRTSSGKVRRQASRTLWRAGRIGAEAPAIWQQTLRLQLATAVGQARRALRTGGGMLFAAWSWTVLIGLSPIAWLGALLLPKLSWRWRAIRAASRLLFLGTGTPLTVRGLEHLDHRPCVLVANHASYLDVLTIVAALPRPVAFVAKAELAGAWYTRLPMQRIGARFVERFDRRKGLEDYRQIASAARAGHSPLFFPEGTFRRAPGLMPFRMGAFACAVEAKLPVIPVALRGTRAILPSGSWFPRRGKIEVTVAAATAVGDADDRWSAALALRDQVRTTMLALTGERST